MTSVSASFVYEPLSQRRTNVAASMSKETVGSPIKDLPRPVRVDLLKSNGHVSHPLKFVYGNNQSRTRRVA